MLREAAPPWALVAGPGALRALRVREPGRLEVALGAGGYVRLGADGWLLLAGPRAPAGPLSLLVAGLGGRPAEVGWEACVDDDGVLVVGPHRIGVGAPIRCACSPSRSSPGPCAGPAMACALAACPPASAALRPGLAALARAALAPAVELLAGRGDGLTPAGDDVLAGFAAAMWSAGAPVALADLAASRASPIGLAYLRCAERGELPAPAAGLIAAVCDGDVPGASRHARALRAWGSSSGSALVWGIAAACNIRRGTCM
jgi:hypothetical protein